MPADADYIKKYREKRKQDALSYLGGKCAKCGNTNNLEIDHVDPNTKSFTVSGYTGSKVKWLAELDKCQLLCSNCHKEKTREDQAVERICGTSKKYRFDGCRCADCVEAMRVDRRRWNLSYRGRV